MHRKLYYKKMVDRHRVHTDALTADISYRVKADLDWMFNIEKEGQISLQNIILDLKVESKDNIMFGTWLFHSVDFSNQPPLCG